MFAAALNNMAAYQLLLTNGANANLQSINQQIAQDMLPINNKSPKQAAHSCNNNSNRQGNFLEPSRARKSSNLISPPTFFISPQISPVTPLAFQHHQFFFPADFCGQIFSPAAMTLCHHRSSPEMHYQIASPMPPPLPSTPHQFHAHVPVFSPFLNERITHQNGSSNDADILCNIQI